jgi:glycosyltransferase involved in cell wall biosynthesis
MKIAILSTNDTSGGAAIAAYRLFRGLGKVPEMDVKMIVREKRSDDPNVIALTPKTSLISKVGRQFKSRERFKRLKALKNQNKIPWFSDDFSDVNLSECKELQECDVINVHWTSEFAPLSEILNQFPDKKVVVTLHDEHHFTGGCHYDLGCSKYRTQCKQCPQADYLKIKDSTYKIFHNRKSSYTKYSFDIIALNTWMENKSRESHLFKNQKIYKIQNGLSLQEWKSFNKIKAREELKLPKNNFIILSGSVNPINFVKGGDLLREIQSLTPSLIDNKKVTNITFGNKHSDLDEKVYQYGFIEDQETMNLLYSAADVFCITSRYDNLPNTVLEAMASGTPVIGFAIGGVPDMIEDTKTGYLVPPYSIVEFIEKIKDFLLMPVEVKMEMSYRSRKRIEENFSSERQVREYLKIFNSD